MRLFLVRHGEVVPPAPGAFYGGWDVPLSTNGEREARLAGQFLQPIVIDHLAVSPLARARYGAKQVAVGRSITPQVYTDLREIDRGRWAGLTRDEIERRYPGDLDSLNRDPDGWRGHGGESLGDLRRRVLGVRDTLLTHFFGATVVIVSHLWPSRTLLADAKNVDYARWRLLNLPTASVSMIDYRDDGRAEVGWVGHKPDGLSVTQVFPQRLNGVR